eukprot:gene26584-33185_t
MDCNPVAAGKETKVKGAVTGKVLASSADVFILLEEAKLLLSEGLLNEPLVKLLAAYDRDPDNQETNSLIGSILLAQQQFEESEKFLIHASVISNWSDSAAVTNLATAFRHRGDVNSALQALKKGLAGVKNADTNGELGLAIADTLYSAGNYSAAAEWYLGAAKQKGSDAEVWIKASTVRYPEPGFDEVFATNVLLQAVDVNNQSAELFFNLGLVGHKTGRFDFAVPMYKKALDLLMGQGQADVTQTVYFDAVSSLATVLHEQGSFVEAEEFYRVAEKIAPNNVILLSNYATLLAGLHRWEEGLQLAKRAIALDPSSKLAQNTYDQFVLTL